MDITNNATPTKINGVSTVSSNQAVASNNTAPTAQVNPAINLDINNTQAMPPMKSNVLDTGHTVKDFFKDADLESKAYNNEGLKELVDELNARYNPLNLSISFAYSEDINSLYVQIRRIDTNEVVRQIPSEEAINLMNTMRELQGAIFDTQA